MPPRKRKRETRPVTPPSDAPYLISTLPDAVIASVLSLLPIKESVRTSILSSRWRHLWCRSPINIDDSYLLERPSRAGDYRSNSYENHCARSREIVSRIISTHSGPIRSCSLSMYEATELYPTVDGFIETLVQRGIEELHLRFYKKLYKLPSSLVFCKSLSKLSLKECRFLDPPFSSTCFPNLKDLRLIVSNLSEEAIHCLLALRLESLELSGSTDASLIRVSSLTLRKLCLRFYCHGGVKTIIIEDAPNLKQLMLRETMTYGNRFVVQHAPNLKQLGFVALQAELFQLGSSSFCRQEDRRISAHCTMKLVGRLPARYDIHWEKLGPFDFVRHLKTVTIKKFGNYYCDVEFARFLVLSSRVLRKMTLLCSERLTNKQTGMMSRELCLANKASPELEVTFLKDSYDNPSFSLWNELIEQL